MFRFVLAVILVALPSVAFSSPVSLDCYVIKASAPKLRKLDMTPVLGDCTVESATLRSGILKVRCEDNDEIRYITTENMVCALVKGN